MDASSISALVAPLAEPVTPSGSAGPDATVAGVRPASGEAAALYEAWAPRVGGYIRFRVADAADAEDLVGEVFRRVVSGPAPVDPAARPAWIFRVAHNVVVDHYRHRRFPPLPATFTDRADDAPSLPDRVIHDERMRATDVAMRSLPEWILVADDASTFISTTDGGATWRTVTGAAPFRFKSVSFGSPDVGWAIPDCGAPFSPHSSLCDPTDPKGIKKILIQTTDGGATWTRVGE